VVVFYGNIIQLIKGKVMFLNQMCYIAAPYWSSNEVSRTTRRQLTIQYSMMLTSMGILNYSPLLYSEKYKNKKVTENYWLTHGKIMVKACNLMIVLMLPGWEDSSGIKGEIKEAEKLGIPVRYVAAGKRLAVCGSRSLDSEFVRQFVYEKIKELCPSVIVTHGEPTGVCEFARYASKEFGIPLKLHHLQKHKKAGMFEHRSKAVFNDSNFCLYVHDGVSNGCANEKKLGDKMNIPGRYYHINKKGEHHADSAPLAEVVNDFDIDLDFDMPSLVS